MVSSFVCTVYLVVAVGKHSSAITATVRAASEDPGGFGRFMLPFFEETVKECNKNFGLISVFTDVSLKSSSRFELSLETVACHFNYVVGTKYHNAIYLALWPEVFRGPIT